MNLFSPKPIYGVIYDASWGQISGEVVIVTSQGRTYTIPFERFFEVKDCLLESEIGVGVVFIGTGETSNDIEMFNPESFLSRLLGMGDLQGLIEKVRSAVGDKEIEKAQKRMEEGKFNLRDFQSQLGSMESLGSMDKLMSMVPGLGKVKDKIGEEKLEGQQTRARHWKYAIDSMTEEEIENPEILEKQTSRLGRIAKGSGTTTSDLRALIKQYKLLKEMIKSQSMLGDGNLDQKTMMKIAKKFGKRMRF